MNNSWIMTPTALIRRFSGHRLSWRVASSGDLSDVVIFAMIARDEEALGGTLEVPDLFLHTDERSGFIPKEYWKESEEPQNCELNSVLHCSELQRCVRSIKIGRVAEYDRLEGIEGKLAYSIGDSNLGRVIEYKVTITLDDGYRFSSHLIFAFVESSEFATRFLLPARRHSGNFQFEVPALWTIDYKTSFNGIKFAGVWPRHIAGAFGGRVLFTDEISGKETVDSVSQFKEVYPDVRDIVQSESPFYNRVDLPGEAAHCLHAAGMEIYLSAGNHS